MHVLRAINQTYGNCYAQTSILLKGSYSMPSHKRQALHLSKKAQPRVCIIGAGERFFSGISVYTCRLANAMAGTYPTSVITMRQLLPTRFYPGHQRVGTKLSRLSYDPQVQVCDGVDWYWLPSIFIALAFLIRERPKMVIFQWWTGTVLHSYILLAIIARLLGAEVVIEFHEVLDTGELKIPLARAYVAAFAPLLMRLAAGFAVHSEHDLKILEQRYRFGTRPITVLPHGPHDHYQYCDEQLVQRIAPATCCNLLFFGVIRPYKGLEDLIEAFNALPEDQINRYWLTIVGETWENWTTPADMIAQSRYGDRITFINRYVHDEEVGSFFAAADAVVLPYHRISTSGPIHIAMGYGLPIVATNVGGIPETVAGYEGAILIPAHDPERLSDAILQVVDMRGQQFTHPISWSQTGAAYGALLSAVAHKHPSEKVVI